MVASRSRRRSARLYAEAEPHALSRRCSGGAPHLNPKELPRKNDQTPELPPDIGQSPMPYPSYGIEFSHGLSGHLKLRLQIHNDDMWIKDDVQLFTRRIRQKSSGIDSIAWIEDSEWSHVGSWPADKAMSTDSSEGVASWSLNLT